MRTVAFVVFERVVGLDVTGPVEVFDMANREHGAEDPAYRVEILSLPGGPVRMASGLELFAKDASQWIGAIDTLIVPGGIPQTVATPR